MVDLHTAPVPPVTPEDHVRGQSGQRLVILYGELTCPRCALAHQRLREAPVRLVFRHFALRSRPRAVALAHALEAAAAQRSFWALCDALFADQGHQDDPHLWAQAQRLGIDLDRFEADRRRPEVAERVAGDVRGALRAGVTGTPALVLEGRVHHGQPPAELLAAR